jgi:endoglucanase
LDTGLNQKELAKKRIRTGTFVSFEQNSFRFVGSEKVISGKALDDRIGCFILLELAKRLQRTKHNIYYVFTVQEEIGLYGAKTSAYQIPAAWSIVVDVTGCEEEHGSVKIGKGPVITLKDSEMFTNKCINDWMEKIARKHNIPVQFEVTEEGTTDALSISISKEGIPASVLSVPVKNLHSAIGIAHFDDMENAAAILETLLKNPPTKCWV